MDPSLPVWQQFEQLVSRILQANNFRVETHSPRGDDGFDLLAYLGNENWAVEVKYYRTANAQPSLIEAAATRVVNRGSAQEVHKGMLVVSSILPNGIRGTLEKKYSIVFVDRVDLRRWASSVPRLAEELDALFEEGHGSPADLSSAREDPIVRSRPLQRQRTAEDTRGTELCHELKNVNRGRTAWAEYERVCENILKYLFQNDLEG